jgi:hypothetical protein
MVAAVSSLYNCSDELAISSGVPKFCTPLHCTVTVVALAHSAAPSPCRELCQLQSNPVTLSRYRYCNSIARAPCQLPLAAVNHLKQTAKCTPPSH